MLKNRFLILLFLCFCLMNAGYSQKISITAKLDSSHIVIGDHLKMQITVSAPSNHNVTIPEPKNWTLQNCEVVESTTLNKSVNNNQNIYNQTITLTSFDIGKALVFPVSIFNGDTLLLGKTDTLSFSVDTLNVFVDTTKAFKDIKLPMPGEKIAVVTPPGNYSTLQKILFGTIGGLLLLAVLFYLWWKYGRKYWLQKKLIAEKILKKENAGQLAMKNLKELKTKKLWQNGMVKDYYSELSMILRTYIDHQWDVNAKEMVTSQIMDEITSLDVNDEQMNDLHQIFLMADLAKYAKSQPLAENNELNFKNAYRFVQSTDSNEKRKKMEEIQQKRFKKN